jgi:hypothetical protein
MYKKNRVLEIDVREYLKNHLNYLQDKEAQQIQKDILPNSLTTSFTDFEKKNGEQLSLF